MSLFRMLTISSLGRVGEVVEADGPDEEEGREGQFGGFMLDASWSSMFAYHQLQCLPISVVMSIYRHHTQQYRFTDEEEK
jgi:hypothetical protein